MKSLLQNVQVLFVKRYSMEGNSASNYYCLGEKRSDEAMEGQEIMKLVGSYESFDSVRGKLPGKFDIEIEMVSGGKDKMVMKALSINPVGEKPTKAA